MNLESQLQLTLQSRRNLHQVLTTLPKEILVRIPQGFRNNIWWNIAHVVATQQILVYKFSGLPMQIPQELVAKFMKGTVPDGTASDEEINLISDLIISTIQTTKTDLERGIFEEYIPYTTSAGFSLNSIVDAVNFNLHHEGLHTATITTQRKVLQGSVQYTDGSM